MLSRLVLCAVLLCAAASASATPVRARDGTRLTLDAQHFHVDPSRAADDVHGHRYRSLHRALADLPEGREDAPSVIYLEPAVYWLNGTATDRGLYIRQDWVQLVGLSEDARDVVLADNRGHTLGAHSPSGSSPAESLFVTGTGFHARNLTIGNYCNVDLLYPRDAGQNRPRRSDTVTQAYAIGASNPDKELDQFHFENVRFISLLDTIALGQVQRVFYDRVFVQGTDDFIGGGRIHVFRDSVIHSFTSKPIYSAGRDGIAFIDTRWEVDFADPGDLMLSKRSSPLYLIRTAFHDLRGTLGRIRWAADPADNVLSYEYGNTRDGKPLRIEPRTHGQALEAEQLDAYSVYNLLKGEDGWNPAALPAQPDRAAMVSLAALPPLRTGEPPAPLEARVFPQGASPTLEWSAESDAIAFRPAQDGTMRIVSRHQGRSPLSVRVTARAANGIVGHTRVTALPALGEPPAFSRAPRIRWHDGRAELDYALAAPEAQADRSRIDWYRVDDAAGTHPIPLAQARGESPLRQLAPGPGELGHFLMARIRPKLATSHAGDERRVVSERAVEPTDIGSQKLVRTDFRHFPTMRQPRLIDQTWTLDTFRPQDQRVHWQAGTGSGWHYGEGIDGAANRQGLITSAQGARLLYTRDVAAGDMHLNVQVTPEKQAAQGFGSPNGQYLEIYIQYDTRSLSGYALRIERTPQHSNASTFTLYEYRKGIGHAISPSLSATAFAPDCEIALWTQDRRLHASVSTRAEPSSGQREAGLPSEVRLEAEIENTSFGGFGLQHTGTVAPGNRTMLRQLSVRYGR